jgi:ectoine hydroxylase-related dioxygenase (phytanoyl-CoA dioxygenase family)
VTPSSADLARFHEDGLLVVRRLFDPDDYRDVCRDLGDRLMLLERRHALDGAPRGDDMRSLSERLIRLERHAPGAQSALYDAMNAAPALHRVATDERLLGAVRALLSPTVALHHRFIVLMSLPDNEWHLPVWHQDWFYNRGPHSTLTVWAPLQPVDAQNGALLLAAGAWRRGFIEHGEHDHGVRTKWVSLPPDTVAGWDRMISATLDVGDVLLFNSLVPHSARLNRSPHVRFVINLRYQDLADPDFLAAGWRVPPAADARAALARRAPEMTTS